MISKLDFFVKILNWYPFNLQQRRPPIPTNVTRWNLRVTTLFKPLLRGRCGFQKEPSCSTVHAEGELESLMGQIFGKNAPKFIEWFSFSRNQPGCKRRFLGGKHDFSSSICSTRKWVTLRFLGTFKFHEYFDKVNLLNMFFVLRV